MLITTTKKQRRVLADLVHQCAQNMVERDDATEMLTFIVKQLDGDAPALLRDCGLHVLAKNALELLGAKVAEEYVQTEFAKIRITDNGSTWSFTGLNDAGQKFLNKLDADGWQWLGCSLVMDHRVACQFMNEAMADGVEFTR